ncbi:Ppx/GppA phosphatase family protein [Hoeflea sp. TYP-13]|uniref:Ppx/GppA phosphatase family protein n=1 Tax=Hoeflea sp. TYP-13 TaxID=3230023 RepID=UPI0034C6C3F8
MTDPADDASASGNGALRTGEVNGHERDVRSREDGAQGIPSPDARTAREPGSQGEDGSRRFENDRQKAAGDRPDERGVFSQNSDKKRRRRRSRRGKSGRGQNAGQNKVNGSTDEARDPHGASHKRRARPVHWKDGAGEAKSADGAGAQSAKPGQGQQSGRNSKHFRGKRYSGNAPLYAALDLGTNNCRLLVALPTKPGQFRVVDAFSRIVRLGEGLGASGRLSQAAMDRAVDALKVCATKLENRPVRRHRLIATEACRSAANGAEFLDRVKSETGLDLEIVNRETEARLAVSGCSSLVGRETDGVVLFDIGGGSSEIAAIDLSGSRSNRLANHIAAWTSLPVGVVTLSERHGGRDVTSQIFADMVEEVADLLEGFRCPEIPGCNGTRDGVFHLLGTSGTVTTLAGVHLDLPRYDRRRVDGLWLSSRDVDRMTEKLLSWDFHARSSNPCIGSDRADLVLAGCAILEAIRRRWPSERLRVADRGLREGLLTEMMAADGIWRRGRGRRNYYKRQQGQGPKRGPRPGERPEPKETGR